MILTTQKIYVEDNWEMGGMLSKNYPGTNRTEAMELAARHGLKPVSEYHTGVLPILRRKHPLLPKSLMRVIENWAAGRPGLARHSAFKIYVFRHAEAPSWLRRNPCSSS